MFFKSNSNYALNLSFETIYSNWPFELCDQNFWLKISVKNCPFKTSVYTVSSICLFSVNNQLFYVYSPSLLALQPSVALHLLHGFVTVNFLGVESLSARPVPSLEDQGLHVMWPIPFCLSGMGGPTRSLRSRQHSSPCHWGAQTCSPRQCGSPMIKVKLSLCLTN
jgi:hypothetical protein